MISNSRKKHLLSWKRRLYQHATSTQLILRRLKKPRQSALLFISPFIDRKLIEKNDAEINGMLANVLKRLVDVKKTRSGLISLKEFQELSTFETLSINNESKIGPLFEKYGSDKTRENHDIVYEKILRALLEGSSNVIQIFEIGLGTNNIDVPSNMGIHGKPGASLRAFRDYSERIVVVGADVDTRVLFNEERISTYYVDQLNLESLTHLSGLVQQSQLIIDDGLHNAEANVNVLTTYMNVMQSGSWLVIEDISRDDFSRKLWMHIRMLMSEFDSYILELSNKFMFIAKKR